MPVRLTGLVTALTFVVLALAALWLAPRLFVLFDEAYNLSVSMTLARDGSYATRLADGYRLFDPAISTGPVVLAPMALALRLGGATLPVARGTMVVFLLASLLAAFLAAREFLDHWAALVFVVVLAATPLVMEFGLCVLGDIPALALGLAALALLKRAEAALFSMLWLLAGGVCLGLAILAKDIMALLALAMLLAWCWTALADRGLSRARLLTGLMPAIVGLGMAAGWRGWQLLAARRILSPEALAAWQASLGENTSRQWRDVVFAPLSHTLPAIQQALDYFGPLLAALALSVGLVVVLRRQRLATCPAGQSLAWRTLAAGCLVWFVWYALLSGPQATHRHLLFGVVLGQIITIRTGEAFWRRPLVDSDIAPAAWAPFAPSSKMLRPYLPAIVLGAILLWSIGHGVGYARLYLQSSEPRLAMQQTAAAWIKESVPEDGALSGWGWFVPWHVAFLAGRLPSEVKLATQDLQGVTEWFVLSPEIIWGNASDDRLRDFLARQGPPAVDQRLYPVYRITWRP